MRCMVVCHLRGWLESRHQPFVLVLPRNQRLWWQQPRFVRADTIADSLTLEDWKKLSAGSGAKGERWYDWARLSLAFTDK
nr:hypothetical protein [Photorhabdus khanii]